MWGINRDAYNAGTVKVPVKEYNGKFYPCDSNGKFLKGKSLFDYCNKLANITEMDNYNIEISESPLADRYEKLND